MLFRSFAVILKAETQGQQLKGVPLDIHYTVEYIKKKYKHYLYIELMPEERKNAAFYEKHGFRIMPDGAPMFLANYENKI